MDIPVYLIAGFLDSGKTGFINGILRDGFAEEDRTLLICCEEGELEYDPRVLGNVFTYTVDEQSQLTPELFKKLEKQYRPKQVIIEYNGMWMIEPLYRDGLPANWILYQIMCLVDARSFEMYVKNMGQLMMEKISNADMLIFNHCNEELRAQLRSRNLRMVNRRADIYLENEDGTSEEYVTPEMSPFDLSDGHLDVPDDDYGVWYVDMMDNPDRYDGVTVLGRENRSHEAAHVPLQEVQGCPLPRPLRHGLLRERYAVFGSGGQGRGAGEVQEPPVGGDHRHGEERGQ